MPALLKSVLGPRLLRILIIPALLIAFFAVAIYTTNNLLAAGSTLCKDPPFLSASAKPMVMLVMSKDHTNYFEAYSDTQKLKDNNATIQTTYTNDVAYYGYFDSNKCYKYDASNFFYPDENTTSHYCATGNNRWSGNFLNWATMTRMDILRKVLFGGYRSTDSSTTTILERAYIPDEGHSWVKVYQGSDLDQLTPYSKASLTDGALSLYAVTCTSSMNNCKDTKQNLPVMRVVAGKYDNWDATEVAEGYVIGEAGDRAENSVFNPPSSNYKADLVVRVKVCTTNSEGCKEYSPGKYKPVGLLQKYGEGDTMHFGLLTGSYDKNLSGGVLRKRAQSIKNEINTDGTFSSVNGLIKTINAFKLLDKTVAGSYSGTAHSVDMIKENKQGLSGYRNWGNPVGEMLYEALRYFAGRASANSTYSTGTTDSGVGLGLSEASWYNPYTTGNNATYDHPSCSKPYILLLSDIYNSYDDDQLPGRHVYTYDTAMWPQGVTDTLGGLNVETVANKIYNDEKAHATGDEAIPDKTFIGEVGDNSTNAGICSGKGSFTFGKIRGLCPGYSGVRGSYYPAAVAHYGRITDLNSAAGDQKPSTFVVALANPLPQLTVDFDSGQSVTISPVARSETNDAAAKPTNCSYVKARLLGQNATSTTLEVDWEDSYQGNDFDKDWIQRIKWTKLSSTQLAVETWIFNKNAGNNCFLGYVISGTTADDLYRDLKIVNQSSYNYNTSHVCSVGAGTSCVYSVSANVVTYSKRIFTVGSATNAAEYLKPPLWYAAKWGGFDEMSQNGTAGYGYPDLPAEWDKDNDGQPDNYFFVTNPAKLFSSLDKAFSQIMLREGTAGAVATVTQEVHEGDIVVRAAFETYDPTNPSVNTWWGHLESYEPYDGCSQFSDSTNCLAKPGCSWTPGSPGSCSGAVYSFQFYPAKFCNEIQNATSNLGHCMDGGKELAGQTTRTIFTMLGGSKTSLDSLDNSTLKVKTDLDGGGVASSDVTTLRDWVKGDDPANSSEAQYLRDRQGWKLGDIVYSTPVTVGPPSLATMPRQLVGDDFRTFVANNAHRDQMVYVGANDGMMHAFNLGTWSTSADKYIFTPGENATLGAALGQERWAYIPSNQLTELQCLADAHYGTSGSCSHRFMVDLSHQVWDAKLGGNWASVVLGGQRGGGDQYFALDVTDPSAPAPLWEFSVLKNYPADAAASALFSTYYSELKKLPISWSLPYVGRLRDSSAAHPNPYVAFFGGGIHEFNPDQVTVYGTTTLNALGGNGWKYLYYPTFHAIDLESSGNGTDLWKGAWTTFLQDGNYTSAFPVSSTPPVLPYAVGNVAAYDLFDSNGRSIARGGTQDGFTDLLYGGDMNGTFYELVMDSAGDDSSASVIPSCMVGRKVKRIVGANDNHYRGSRQPITVTPVAALDKDKNLRVYFGTGKFDDVPAAAVNDKNDNATMSFYCLTESLAERLFGSNTTRCDGTNVAVNPFRFATKCREDNATRTYRWVTLDNNNASSPDGGNCFSCILDLKFPGERVIDSALVAGGYVFFTTFVPKTDVCSAGGDAYLYVLDYMCKPLKSVPIVSGGAGTNFYDPKTNNWTTTEPNHVGAVRVDLGQGMPSRPVLDSSGTSIFVQTSNAQLIRIGIDLGEGGKSKVEGWTRD
jgi:type IV pilus assembly protein PilY1